MQSRSLKLVGVLVALAFLIALVVPLVGANAAGASATLKITGLDGGTEVTTFGATSFDYSIEGITGTDGGGGAGKAVLGPLVVSHTLKSAESLILKATAQGRHLPKVQLVVKVDDKTIATFTLTDVLISRATMSGKSGRPETSFTYDTIDVNVMGSSFCWDVSLNIAC